VARHSLAEHTGELELHLEAASLDELFGEAARALAEIMGGPLRMPPEGAWEEVRLHATDRDALLVDWLNELIFRSERDKKIFDEIHVTHASEHALVAAIRGRVTEEVRLHVKAATFHKLEITELVGAGGLSANLILDV
jgi:SHS2 domain-containing protein